MNKFRVLFWKECRQHAPIAIALFALCCLLQLVWVGVALFAKEAMPLIPMALAFTALYATSLAAIMFSGEHDEKTFALLQRLPIRSSDIRNAKIGWLLVSSGILCAAAILFALFAERFSGADSAYGSAFVLIFLLEGVCWGLFWTTRLEKQLDALLATYISAALCAFVLAPLLPVRIAIAVAIGAIGVWQSNNWLKKSRELCSRDRVQRTRLSFCSFFPRSENTALLWHAVVQSKSLLYKYAAIAAAILVWLYINIERQFSFSGNEEPFLFAIGILVLITICGSVFAADQHCGNAAMLSHRGVSPAKIWWSRFLVFAAFITVPFLIAFPVRNTAFFYAIAALMCFCLGQAISLFVKSPIVAIVFTGIAFMLFSFWAFVTAVCFGMSPYWTTLPILAGILVSSRLYAHDWLNGKTFWQAKRRVWAALLLPIVAVFVAIPFVRVYSVPTIDLGFRLPRYSSHFNKNDMERIDKELDMLTQPNATPQKYEKAWIYKQELLRNPNAYPLVFWDVHSVYNCWINIGNDPEKLRQKIAILEKMPQYRAETQHLVAMAYVNQLRLISGGFDSDNAHSHCNHPIFHVLRRIPWERRRAEKKLANLYQLYSALAMRTDASVFHNFGEHRAIMDAFYRIIYPQEFYLFHDASMPFFKRIANIDNIMFAQFEQDAYVFSPYKNLEWERNRRAELIVTALHLWHIEHGELPETLEQLKGVYLTDVPLVPVQNVPFGFQRDWKETDENEKKRSMWQDETVPRIFTPRDRDYARSYPLHFMQR